MRQGSMHMRGIDEAAQHVHTWLNEVQWAMGVEDRQEAYHALRAVLQTLRDRLSPEESAQLAAQLPTLIRGIYYEGYHPGDRHARIRTAAAFIDEVCRNARGYTFADPERATHAVLSVLGRRVSHGEVTDVLAQLPDGLHGLWTPMTV